jgi:Leucine-rich repeat (LRR) protein
MVIEGNDYQQINAFLQTSRGFNESMLRAVTELDLSNYNNKITLNVMRNLVDTFPNLRSLKLRYNPGVQTGLAQLQNLKQLTSLDLSDSGIGTADFLTLNAPNLTSLSLGLTGINDVVLPHLQTMTKLSTLSLYACGQITSEGIKHLELLKSLTSLDLGSNHQLTDAWLVHIQSLTNLTHLSLRNDAGVTDAGITQILQKLTNLTSLDLNGNVQITDAILPSLLELTNLKEVDLSTTGVTEGAKATLRAKGIKVY